MLRPICLLLLPIVITALAGPLATRGAADGGRCGDRGKPPCTILRPPQLGPPSDTHALAPECIVAVGGFGSTSGDRAFDALLGWTGDESLYQVFHFGHRDDRFEYDTTGPIDVSGEDLRSFVASLAPDCRAIHIVAHSMGGAVADRAFSKGLSAQDRVATYLALSSPHNGATLAQALRRPIERDPLLAIEISVLARTLGQPDPTTQAARDLADLVVSRPRREIRVPSARLRVATDGMVLRRDNIDRRADVREYFATDALEGHGGILHNDQVRRVLQTTVASHEIAVDNRSQLERGVADAVSRKLDADLSGVYAGLSWYLASDPSAPLALAEAYGAVALSKAVWRAVEDVLAEIPGALVLLAPPGMDLVRQ